MLSVGIDINRLGLMTVYGQPKSTAEYIQSTSRVGRANPGLVIVLLHMLRSRDKGHFEQFQTYHQTFNRMVEPTSATPCACMAMDKALHASFVILLRQLCPSLRANGDAANFRKDDPQVLALRDELLSSVQERSPETVPYAKNIDARLREAEWCSADPLCMTSTGRNGQGLFGLNYAACLHCALLSETSCAMRNVLLDRAALIGREDDGVSAFFDWDELSQET